MLCCTCVHTQQWCHSVLTHLWIHFSHISWCQLLFKWLLNLRQDSYFEWHHYTKFNCICLKSKFLDVKKNLKLITELKCLVVLPVKFKNVAAIEYLIMLDEQKHCWVTCDSYFIHYETQTVYGPHMKHLSPWQHNQTSIMAFFITRREWCWNECSSVRVIFMGTASEMYKYPKTIVTTQFGLKTSEALNMPHYIWYKWFVHHCPIPSWPYVECEIAASTKTHFLFAPLLQW